jgi:plasmid replication initiation protein
MSVTENNAVDSATDAVLNASIFATAAQPSTPFVESHGERLISRDEMNLAEFPLTVLSTRASPSVKTLEFRDTIRKKNGEIVNREWIITGADKFGLPTASDDEILIGLLKLTVDQGFVQRKVFFTRYELLKVLNWTTEGRSYQRLQKAFDRLSGVRIKATNAFYDNAAKSHSTINFGLIDNYEINDGREAGDGTLLPSFFTWSDVLFRSFQVGYIKKLDLGFYLKLQSAVSKRLYRFLDKHFWYRSKIRIKLFMLAHEKLGVSRNYRFVSSLKQQIDPAIAELMATGFLTAASYEGKGEETEAIFIAGKGIAASPAKELSTSEPTPKDLKTTRAVKNPLINSATNFDSEMDSERGVDLPASATLQHAVTEKLESRGLRPHQVVKLLANRAHTVLERMLKIVDYYDYLIATRSRLVSLSPVGFLYRAIENPLAFKLPDDRDSIRTSQKTFSFETASSNATAVNATAANVTVGPQKTRKTRDLIDESLLEAEYVTFRKRELQKLRSEAESHLLGSMTLEAEEELKSLSGVISIEHFKEAIEHRVDDKLASLFAVPDLNEWKRNGKELKAK